VFYATYIYAIHDIYAIYDIYAILGIYTNGIYGMYINGINGIYLLHAGRVQENGPLFERDGGCQ
jgi:hypothetical protein